MKKLILATTTAIVLGAGITGIVMAKEGDYGRHQNRVDRMSQALELSTEQKAQLEEIFLSKSEQREQMRNEMQAQIDQILTPEQLELKQRMQERRGKDRMGDHQEKGHHDRSEKGKYE